MRYMLISVVGGVHVAVIGGILLMQGCGTTRGPVSLPDAPPMPPTMAAEDLPPVSHVTPYKPASIDDAVAALPKTHSSAAVKPSTPTQPKTVLDPDESVRTYVVGKGDSLSVIAHCNGVSVADLMLLNNISNPNKIRFGQKLKLPASASVKTVGEPKHSSAPATTSKTSAGTSTASSGGDGHYLVKAGDSLSVIAHRHKTTVKALQEVNGLKNDRIQVGQKLVLPTQSSVSAISSASSIPTSSAPKATIERPLVPSVPSLSQDALAPDPAPTSSSRSSSYTVQVGDSMLTVASEHNVSIYDLRRVNQLSSDTLIPGQMLVIPSAE